MTRRIDPWLVATTLVLIAFGLVMVFSASAVIAMERSGDEAYYLKRQLMALGAGTVLCAVTAITPTRVIRRYRTVLYTMTIIGLLLCFVPFAEPVDHETERRQRLVD